MSPGSGAFELCWHDPGPFAGDDTVHPAPVNTFRARPGRPVPKRRDQEPRHALGPEPLMPPMQPMLELDDLKIAVVHEWLDARSGSEITFEAIARSFPAADLYALTVEPDVPFDFGGRTVRTTLLDQPIARRKRAATLPIMPLAWRWLGAPVDYDVVITSSHAFAKCFPATKHARHFDYCHTPMRYVWMPELDGRSPALAKPIQRLLRSVDRSSARTVDHFAANSAEVTDRIERFYGRRATIIAPPVDTDFYTPGESDEDDRHVFAVSRHIEYKRLDLAIEASIAAGMPIVVGGDGPLRSSLMRDYGSERLVTFTGRLSPHDLREHYRRATALVFPAFEDFGIVPVEAQACGTPVIAFKRGGSTDTIVDGVTGVLVPVQTVDAFADAIKRVAAGDLQLRAAACRENAVRFGHDRFRNEMRSWVRAGLDAPWQEARQGGGARERPPQGGAQ